MTRRKRVVKTFTDQMPQGEIYLRRVDALPTSAVAAEPQASRYVLGHSETGHHHVVAAADDVRFYREPSNPMICYLVVDGAFADLVHLRVHDTHATLRIPTGVFEVRRQREFAPEGWRPVLD